MKLISIMFTALLAACTYGDDAVDEVERTLVVDCNLQSVKDMCKQCGGSGTFDCCRSISAPDVCDVRCDNWMINPRTGKKYC